MIKTCVPIIHMTEGNILCRCPESLYGKRFSVISLGMCNFHCPYCQLGGGLPRTNNQIPLAIDVSLRDIEIFIENQVAKGNPVKVSGGEPTVNMPLALHLIDYIKSCGGYACADTSGWDPNSTKILAQHVDQIAIDLKGPPRYVQKITGVDLDKCWYRVLESIKMASREKATLEIRTVVFGFTTSDDLKFLSKYIPANAYWLIRRFLTDWVPFDKYAQSKYAGFEGDAVTYPPWLISPTPAKMYKIMQETFTNEKCSESHYILLVESPRDSKGETIAPVKTNVLLTNPP